jgi:DNA-binding IclR family transcriptional regulator
MEFNSVLLRRSIGNGRFGLVIGSSTLNIVSIVLPLQRHGAETDTRLGGAARSMRKRGQKSGILEEVDGVESDKPGLNSALARGFAILRAFQLGDQHLGNAELAERVGLPKATVSRLTQTLAELGFLTYLDSIGKYELAPAVLSLGYAVLSRGEIHALARPLMQELAKESGLGVGLGVRDGTDMVMIEYARGHYSGGLTTISVGRHIPIAATCMGWACAQGLPPSEQSELFAALRAEHPPERADQIEARMLKAFHEIHEYGYCTSTGEFSPAYSSIGAPFLHPNGVNVLAFHIAGPTYYLPPEDMREKWGPRLVEMVARLRGES